MCLQKVRGTFKPDHDVKWTGKTYLRATFDASLVEGIPDLPLDSTHWVSFSFPVGSQPLVLIYNSL